jgi:transcriptional regulator GlxA family with amidase domain
MTSKTSINSRNVAILVFDDVEVLDFAGPFEVFSVAGSDMPAKPYSPFFTYTFALTDAPIQARGGLQVQAKFSLANMPQPDILIIPGGAGSRRLLKNDRLLSWLRDIEPHCEIVASVCTGALMLAAAGLAKNKSITTHHGAFDRLSELEPMCKVVRDQRYVHDGKFWYSGGISAGIDMSLAIVKNLLNDNAPVIDEMEWMWNT